MSGLLQDVRFALRGFRKSPGFTAVAIATLAIGIGANTAIFSVVDGVLLRPLRFPHSEAIASLAELDPAGNRDNVGWATYADWRRQTKSFEDIAVASYWSPTLLGGASAVPLEGLRVSQGFFRMIGVRPALGRDFLPEEDRPGRNHVAIIGHGLFVRGFGGDPSVVGRTISLGGTTYTLVGVLPEGFESVFAISRRGETEIWAPLGYDATLAWACRTCHHLRAFGRLKPGVTMARASADLSAIQAALARAFPTEYDSTRVAVEPLAKTIFGPVRTPLLILLGAVALVLLLACANVASLLVARMAERRREIAVRISLGAGRARLVRQLLTESLLLSLTGGALGLVLSGAAARALLLAAPIDLPRTSGVGIDVRVLLACAAVSIATGIAFGLAPALAANRIDPAAAIADVSGGTAGPGRRRFLGSLVVLDVALAVVLLCGAGLLIRSLARLFDVDPGFEPKNLVSMKVHLSGPRFREDAAIVAFYRRALDRVRALPGVRSAAVVSQLPLGNDFDAYGVHAEDRPNANPENDPSADRFSVSPEYLAAMGIPLRKGRGLTAADRAGANPVVVVNETLARRFWGTADALGRRVKVGGTDGPWRTIVGIVGDVRHRGLDVPPSPQIYLPEEQFRADNDMTLVIRAERAPAAVAAAASRAVRELDRDQVVDGVATMEQTRAASAGQRRFAAVLLNVFAGIALLLSAIGIYGVASKSVLQRSREFGIRIALGATRGNILGLVAGGSAGRIAAGVALGLAGSLAATRLLAGQLYGVGPRDPGTFGVVAVLAAGLALASSLVPARRATRLDPAAALRES
ncbi:MAG TPA: ABC transporter permease [Thermoanaerobaculia bacterium]|nr:ABC transporter permease [Thermoanaerobaculia bacterium]